MNSIISILLGFLAVTVQSASLYSKYNNDETYAEPRKIEYSAPTPVPAPAPMQRQEYSAPKQQYAVPAPAPMKTQQYVAPAQDYSAPKQQYSVPEQQYAAPNPAPMKTQQYAAPAQDYSAPKQQYAASAPVSMIQDLTPALSSSSTYSSYQQGIPEESEEPMPAISYNPCTYENSQIFHPAVGLSNEYFIQCNWEYPHLFKCPSGLVWNQDILACDHSYKRTSDYYEAPSYAFEPAQSYATVSTYNPAPQQDYADNSQNLMPKQSYALDSNPLPVQKY